MRTAGLSSQLGFTIMLAGSSLQLSLGTNVSAQSPATSTSPGVTAGITAHAPDAFYDPPANVPGRPGVLLRSEPLKDVTLPAGMRSWRIFYTTTVNDDRLLEEPPVAWTMASFLNAPQASGCAGKASPPQDRTAAVPQHDSNFVRDVLDLFNMAGAQQSKKFRPLTQSERNHLYFRSMVNPLSFVRVAASAGIDQARDKPEEWEQGASGYGKRFANIFGQYSISRTVTYGLGSVLHEDNRYFNSGLRRFWPRTGYALASGVLARRDDGTRRFSISQTGGVAAGAFLARLWLPPSQSAAKDGAISLAITTGSNIGFGVFKEFLPDMVRPFIKKRKP